MTPRTLTLGLSGVLCLALAGVIALELGQPPAPAVTSAPPARIGDLPAAAPDDTAALVPVILARPLFSTDRRPKAGPAATGGPSDQLPRLAGILIDGPQRRAIFQAGGDAKPVSVIVGESIAGWQVQEITAANVTLAGPGGTRTLEPKFDPALVAAAPAPLAPPGPTAGAPQPNPRQYLPGGMTLPPGVPNPFAGPAVPAPGRPVLPQPQQFPVRQQGGAPAAPNRR